MYGGDNVNASIFWKFTDIWNICATLHTMTGVSLITENDLKIIKSVRKVQIRPRYYRKVCHVSWASSRSVCYGTECLNTLLNGLHDCRRAFEGALLQIHLFLVA